jgi:catabolite regulation protein CreA
MTIKNSFLPTVLILILLTFLFACGQVESSKKISQVVNAKTSDHSLKVDTFSTFPPDIDGCSCYFSNDSIDFTNHDYIYVNDFAQISFLKINGVMTKFTQTDFKKVDNVNTYAKYKSDSYEFTIEVKDGKQSGDETQLKMGKIKLTDKKGNTLIRNFYGDAVASGIKKNLLLTRPLQKWRATFI